MTLLLRTRSCQWDWNNHVARIYVPQLLIHPFTGLILSTEVKSLQGTSKGDTRDLCVSCGCVLLLRNIRFCTGRYFDQNRMHVITWLTVIACTVFSLCCISVHLKSVTVSIFACSRAVVKWHTFSLWIQGHDKEWPVSVEQNTENNQHAGFSSLCGVLHWWTITGMQSS